CRVRPTSSVALIPRVLRCAVTPRQWIVAEPLHVRPEEPVWPARIAGGPRKVILVLTIADRDLGPGVEVRAPPRDHDHPGPAGAVWDDRRGRLDDGAAWGALDRSGLLLALALGGAGGNWRTGNHRNGDRRNGSQWTQHCNHWAPRSYVCNLLCL